MSREALLADYRDTLDYAHTTVDRIPALTEELVSFLAPTSVEAEQYRALRHAAERLRAESGEQVLAVTSAEPGDGKTVTTLNLAGSLAQSPDARILVVCADLHRDSVTEYLGLTRLPSPGLADLILDERRSLAEGTYRVERLNLSILPTGNVRTQSYELLTSPRLEGLLTEARRLYDYVLVDTPPVVPLADCRLLARCVDGFIVVVAARKTPRKVLAEALKQLGPAKVLGLVFNRDDRPLAPYYGAYGYQQASAHRATSRTSGWEQTSEPRRRS